MPLDLATATPASIKTEVDAGLTALINALDVVEKFANFLPGSVGVEIADGVTVLTEIKALVDKFA